MQNPATRVCRTNALMCVLSYVVSKDPLGVRSARKKKIIFI